MQPCDENILRTALPDGTLVLMRALRREDAPRLAEALRQLSPQARQQRFLFAKGVLSESELEYLSNCDGVKHVAWGMALSDEEGRELQPIAVARCIRDKPGSDLAEVAIVVADEWQHHGAGTLLLRTLAAQAWQVGIRRWQGLLRADNLAARHLLEAVGQKQSEHYADGALEVIYQLFAPER